jgi:aspartate carbamoyltransferase catalytic subunit
MKVKKNQKKFLKIGGKGMKSRKLQGLPLHWFFTNDSTRTNISFVTIESTMVSRS